MLILDRIPGIPYIKATSKFIFDEQSHAKIGIASPSRTLFGQACKDRFRDARSAVEILTVTQPVFYGYTNKLGNKI
jgi:hypothetical protein